MTKQRRKAWQSSIASHAQHDKTQSRRVRAQLPPISQRRDWVIRDMFPDTPAPKTTRNLKED
jgi:hypothetical protein